MSDFPERLTALQPFWGSWVLDSFIGEGSYGKVYRIRREEMGKVFYAALKWITLPKSQSELNEYRTEGLMDNDVKRLYRENINRLREEIDLMSRLKGNSHVVNYEDHMILERENEIGWDILIRMEMLTPLSERFKQGMTVGDVVKLGLDLCDALILCSKVHIIHRDIKPDNIFISEFGEYKLGDFGVARSMEATATHMSKQGTPVYMAPEVYLGKEKYDSTVDIYSLGLVMHRLLNRQRLPFLPMDDAVPTHGERNAALETRLRGTPISQPVDGGSILAKVICKACSFDPQKRYRAAEEMREALQKSAEKTNLHQPITTNPTGGGLGSGRSSLNPNSLENHNSQNANEQEPGNKPPKHRRVVWPWIVLCIATSLVVGGFGMKWWMGQTNRSIAMVTAAPVSTPSPVPTATPTNKVPVTSTPTNTPMHTPTSTHTTSPTATADKAAEAKTIAAIRKAMGWSDTEIITTAMKESVTSLHLNDMSLSDISYLSHFTNLTILHLNNNQINDISCLSRLTKLRILQLNENKISDISSLKGLTNLRELEIYLNAQLTDISPLAGLKNLTRLDLGDDRIEDIYPLQELTKLSVLWLGNNAITNIAPLRNMTNMVELALYGNSIQDISPLKNMLKLRELHLSGNPIKDYSPLSGLEKLTDCDVAYKIPSTPTLTKVPTPTPKATPTPTPRPKDTKAPVIESFQCIPDSVEAPSKVKVTADISDDVGIRSAEVTMLLDTQYIKSTQMSYNKSTSLWECTLSLHSTIREGNFNLEIIAYDKSGNKVKKTYSRALKIINPNQDTIAPVVSTVVASPNSVQVSSSVKISAEITDNLQKITYVECFVSYNGVELYNSQMIYSYSAKQWICHYGISKSARIGNYSVRIYAEDNNGNHSNTNFDNAITIAKTVSTPTQKTTAINAPSVKTNDIEKEIVEFNGHWYLLVRDLLSWNAAKSACEGMGGYLAAVTTDDEMQFISGIIPKKNESNHIVWIGGSDQDSEGLWTWVSGENFAYVNWKSKAEPNNWNNEDYLQIDENPGWNDANGTQLCYYLCEWDSEPVFAYDSIPTPTPKPTPTPTPMSMPTTVPTNITTELNRMYAVGNTVTFGEYEQDNNSANGQEGIQWRVLKRDGSKALLISEYNLDCQPYNDYDEGVTWETCTLRRWLNDSFLYTAFSVEERQAILVTLVQNNNDPDYDGADAGADTYDQVFLLSIEEVGTFLQGDLNRQVRNTVYAEAQGAYTDSNTGAGWWWLRSPGSHSTRAACVWTTGQVLRNDVYYNGNSNIAVRPAFWLNLSTLVP